MPRKVITTRKPQVDLVEIMLRNRKLIMPDDWHLEKQTAETTNNDDKKKTSKDTTIKFADKEERNQQGLQSESLTQSEQEETPKPVHSYNLRPKPREVTSAQWQLNTNEVRSQTQHEQPQGRGSRESPPVKKLKIHDEAVEKKSNSTPKFIRRATPRPTPKATPRATPITSPRPTKTKITTPQKRERRRSAPYKRGQKAKWRSAKASNICSQTRNAELIGKSDCPDSASMVSGSRLYLAEVALQSNSMPKAVTSNDLRFKKRLLTMDETQSTVVLHRNPNFKMKDARRSGKPHQHKPCMDSPSKRSTTSAQKKWQTGTKSPLKIPVPKDSRASTDSETVSSDSTTENSKSTTEESNSFDGDVGEAFSETIMGVVGERKDQELRPPASPPMLPHLAAHSCSLNCYPQLAQILRSMDDFLKSVTKSGP